MVLLGIKVLVDSTFAFSSLNSLSTVFWLPLFLMSSQLFSSFWVPLYVVGGFSLPTLTSFSFSFFFSICIWLWISLCLSSLEFIELHGWREKFFKSSLGSFSHYVFQYVFCSFLTFSHSDTHYVHDVQMYIMYIMYLC